VFSGPELELVPIGLQQTWWILGSLLGLMHDQLGLAQEAPEAAAHAGGELFHAG
jgi:hypothetical protein